MISPKEGVLGKLRRAVNLKCFPLIAHLIDLYWLPKKATKSSKEKFVDTLFYFRDSAVKRDKLKKLQEIIEPENPHITAAMMALAI